MSDVIPVQAPNGLDEIVDHYGDPHVTPQPDGSWTVDAAWERANLFFIGHVILPLGRLYVHRLIADPLLRVFDRWQARIVAGDAYRVRKIGCFAPRAQRGSQSLIPSTHSWAIAFDLNPDENGLITGIALDDPRRQAAKDIPDEWIADACAEGFFWGGRFKTRFDAMHFQLATGY